MNFKDVLAHMRDGLHHMAAHADQLDNKNLSDIIKAGAARVEQAMEHPDAEALPPVHAPGQEPPPFDPGATQ